MNEESMTREQLIDHLRRAEEQCERLLRERDEMAQMRDRQRETADRFAMLYENERAEAFRLWSAGSAERVRLAREQPAPTSPLSPTEAFEQAGSIMGGLALLLAQDPEVQRCARQMERDNAATAAHE